MKIVNKKIEPFGSKLETNLTRNGLAANLRSVLGKIFLPSIPIDCIANLADVKGIRPNLINLMNFLRFAPLPILEIFEHFNCCQI